MKKHISLVLAFVLLALCLTGCATQSANSSSEEDTLSQVMSSGKLVAAFEIGDEPWGYTDPATGNYTGFAVELISGFAASIGVAVEWMPLEFSELIPAVQTGKANIISSNISRTAARSATVLFTDAVGYASCVAVVLSDSPYTNVDQLNDASVTITAPAGSIYEDMAYERFPNATVSALSSTSDAIAALKAGRADVYLTDTNQAYMLMKGDSSVTYLPQYLDTDTVAFALDLDMKSYTLRDAFNTYLKVCKLNGTYNELYNKYFDCDWVPLMDEYGA
ncbi:MAG TPA: ABC transporter substrate-binding protein [Eubacteriales bacterium]|nr:ABC transporter substrate-binding protein [Clostridia bacterium]HRV73374.1 ABC transporter substrate-binding protein [Eubacteriales bacterium]